MTKLPLDKKLGKRRWDELTREFLKHPNVTTVFFTELDVADDVIDHQQDFVEEVVEPAVNVVTEASELNGMVPSSKRVLKIGMKMKTLPHFSRSRQRRRASRCRTR